MVLYSPVVCFMPRNGSCHLKLGPGEAGQILLAVCVHTQIFFCSLLALSQQREGESKSLLLAGCLFLAEARSFSQDCGCFFWSCSALLQSQDQSITRSPMLQHSREGLGCHIPALDLGRSPAGLENPPAFSAARRFK